MEDNAHVFIAAFIFAIIGPMFYNAMDRLEIRMKKKHPDSKFWKVMLFSLHSKRPTKHTDEGG